jgi:polyhydroxyalkanoate synthesis regulator phasin
MSKAEDIIYELIKSKGKMNLAMIEGEADRIKQENPEYFEAITGCNIYDVVEELVEKGRLEKEVPKWGLPTYRIKEK